jgi:hypothetical protein
MHNKTFIIIALVLWFVANPTALAAQHAVGFNIVDGQGTIYQLTQENGQIVRRPYTAAGNFLSYPYNSFTTVLRASAEDLALPIGSFLPPNEGRIICSDKGTDRGTCYLISQGKKAGFTSESVFKDSGFNFANAIYGDTSFLEADVPISTANAAHRPGALILKQGTVYLIAAPTILLGIPDLTTFNSWGYSFRDVIIANQFDDQLIVIGTLAQRPTGKLDPTYITLQPSGVSGKITLTTGGCGPLPPPDAHVDCSIKTSAQANTKLTITRADGSMVTEVTSSTDGFFYALLSPGNYILNDNKGFGGSPIARDFIVTENQFTSVDLEVFLLAP